MGILSLCQRRFEIPNIRFALFYLPANLLQTLFFITSGARFIPPAHRWTLQRKYMYKKTCLLKAGFTKRIFRLARCRAEKIAPHIASQLGHTGHLIGLHQYIFSVGFNRALCCAKNVAFFNDA